MKSEIPGSDFIILGQPKKQCCCLVFGDGGTGKTTIGTRFAPDPVAFINFDGRAEYAVTRDAVPGRKILYTRIKMPEQILKLSDEEGKKAGQRILDTTMRNFEAAVRAAEKGDVRTIVIDTATELGDAIKLATTGRIDRVKGDFGKSKHLQDRVWWSLFEMARGGPANLIMLSRAKSIWVSNEPTGEFTYRCPDVVHDAVDWAAQIRLKKVKKGVRKKEFEMVMKKCGVNIGELGEVYTEEDWGDLGGPFVYACLMQYEGTSEEDWK